MKVLHIIEPTLNSAAGHCLTVVHSLAKAAHDYLPDVTIHAWTGHDFDPSFLADTKVEVHPYFHRKTRLFQLWGLLRRLCAAGQQVLLPTAGRTELAIYVLVPKFWRQRGRVWFYLHQLNMSGTGPKRLAALAKKIPQANILCTHPILLQTVQNAGFTDAKLQPCPFEVPEQTFSDKPAWLDQIGQPQRTMKTGHSGMANNALRNLFLDKPFKQLIFPGEARMDKNLPFIADLIRYMHKKKVDIPVMLQAGPNHHDTFPKEISQVLQEIRDIGYPHLTMLQRMMGGDEYLEQFSGGICLQPYRQEDYTSKISGITLDALTRGCPCVAQHGTWPADVVREFSAGVTCKERSTELWLQSIKKIIDQYSHYQEGCEKALRVLGERHHPLRMLETIFADEKR